MNAAGPPPPSPRPPPPPSPVVVDTPPARNGLAMAGFLCGMLGLLGSWVPFVNIVAILLGAVGAVLSAVGLSRSRRVGAGRVRATIGLVVGLLAVVSSILVNIAVVDDFRDAQEKGPRPRVGATDRPSGEPSPDDAQPEGPGATYDDPAPRGTEVIGDGWRVVVDSVETVVADARGRRPPRGTRLLEVGVSATYEGADPRGESVTASVRFVMADGSTLVPLGGSTAFVADDQLDTSSRVPPGDSVEGNLLLTAPADTVPSGALSVTPDSRSGETFIALD